MQLVRSICDQFADDVRAATQVDAATSQDPAAIGTRQPSVEMRGAGGRQSGLDGGIRLAAAGGCAGGQSVARCRGRNGAEPRPLHADRATLDGSRTALVLYTFAPPESEAAESLSAAVDEMAAADDTETIVGESEQAEPVAGLLRVAIAQEYLAAWSAAARIVWMPRPARAPRAAVFWVRDQVTGGGERDERSRDRVRPLMAVIGCRWVTRICWPASWNGMMCRKWCGWSSATSTGRVGKAVGTASPGRLPVAIEMRFELNVEEPAETRFPREMTIPSSWHLASRRSPERTRLAGWNEARRCRCVIARPTLGSGRRRGDAVSTLRGSSSSRVRQAMMCQEASIRITSRGTPRGWPSAACVVRRPRRGFVIVVVTVVILLISLAAYGFLSLMQVENRAALDAWGPNAGGRCGGVGREYLAAVLELPAANGRRRRGARGTRPSAACWWMAIWSTRTPGNRRDVCRPAPQGRERRPRLAIWLRRRIGQAAPGHAAGVGSSPRCRASGADESARHGRVDRRCDPRLDRRRQRAARPGCRRDYYRGLHPPQRPRNAVPPRWTSCCWCVASPARSCLDWMWTRISASMPGNPIWPPPSRVGPSGVLAPLVALFDGVQWRTR